MTVSFDQLPEDARAWVYTSNRLLTDQEVVVVHQQLEQFTNEWSSHGNPLRAAAQVFDHSIIVVAVEDGWDMASGCSIDKSVGALKRIEQSLGIALFDRMLLLYKEHPTAQVSFLALGALKKGLQEGVIAPEGLIVNTQADSLKSIKNELWIPLKASWMARLLPVNMG